MASKPSAKRKSTPAKKKLVARKPFARPARAGKGGSPTGGKRRPGDLRPAARSTAPARSAAEPPRPAAKAGIKPEAPPAVPNAMGLQIAHVDFTTHNFDEVRRFYTQQMGFTRFDFDPQFHYLMVHTTNSSSLGFAPPPPGYNLPQPPREPTLYFMVKDIHEAYRKLMARGVSFEAPPETMPWGHRVVRTRDPEGRAIWIAQAVAARREK